MVEIEYSLVNDSDSYRLCIRNCGVEEKELLPKLDENNFSKLDKIDEIQFINSQITYFPRLLRVINKDITKLFITHVDLKQITKEDLFGLKELNTLSVTHTNIETLRSDLFLNTRKLQMIDFSNNNILYVGVHILKPLNKNSLKRFDLRSNFDFNIEFNVEQHDEQAIKKFMKDIYAAGIKDSFTPVNNYLSDLWNTKIFSDCKFIFKNDVVIDAHKCILATQSEVLSSCFENNIVRIEIDDEISCEAFEEFLKFLYIREIPEFNDYIFEVYSASIKYQVEKLAEICEEIILTKMNVENVICILKLGNIHSNEMMKFCAFNLICCYYRLQLPEYSINYPDIVKTIVEAEIVKKNEIEEAKKKFEQTYNNMLLICGEQRERDAKSDD